MKQYQSWLGDYLMSRRDGDHAMACKMASSICEFWQQQGDENELDKWQQGHSFHRTLYPTLPLP